MLDGVYSSCFNIFFDILFKTVFVFQITAAHIKKDKKLLTDFSTITKVTVMGKHCNEDAIEEVMRTFIRIYVHACIGGHVGNEFQRMQEMKGKRVKGGENLRDKLHNEEGKW